MPLPMATISGAKPDGRHPGHHQQGVLPCRAENYQTLLSSLSDAFLTSLSYDDIAALVQMQPKDMSGWHVTSYAVSGSGDTSYCYALGDAAWVMRPNMDTVNTAKELIRQVMSGETPQLP